MLDVHAPHERMPGFKDFLLHLLTITIGLLIALSLEGCVEWRHHRSLVREAEEGLRSEIDRNSQVVGALKRQIAEQQKQLNQDLDAVAQLKTDPGSHPQMSFGFGLQGFDEVSWKTAQSTGAIGYMPYADARTYSDIYATQDEVYKAERDVVEGVMRAASFPSTKGEDWKPTPVEMDELTDRIGMLRMRLSLLNSLVDALNSSYGKFKAEQR
ncbi:MAG TPA: hypothetical protein VG267_01275 [Terracidiphilus sp.]|jgi:hypothetical protein|nr:hypothetical protein [Terracidiphilus sp.]